MATATDDSPVRNAGAALEEHPGSAAAGVADRRNFTCSECGHVLEVFGSGRHRVYFETGDERLDDPVMDGSCPGCGHRLPGRNGASPR
jgi:Mrp family chromosome partitioning ATPase